MWWAAKSLEPLFDALEYILAMLVGFAAARLGLRAPGWLFTLVVAALVVIVGMVAAPAFAREAASVIALSLLYSAASMTGSALLASALRMEARGCGGGGGRRGFASAVITALLAGLLLGLAGFEAPLGLVHPLLLLLVFLAGLELGSVGERLRFEPRLVLLPLLSMTGSVAASIPFYLLLGVPPAIAAGMGWYTFTAPYIAAASGSALLAAIALLSNIVREQATIILVSVLGCRIPLPVAVALGGVTTMDTTLPIYVKTYGTAGAVAAVINGAILTILVPTLVPLLYTILH